MYLSTTTHLLTTHQAAAVLGLQPSTLKKWRLLGIGPKYIRVGPKSIRYRLSDLKKVLSETAAAPAETSTITLISEKE